MPTSWVRGLLLARLNSIIRGHSAVSLHVIETIFTFLENGLTPVIPVRGSISASGDLIPLSYLAGALQGNSDIFVRMQNSHNGVQVVPASEALKLHGIKPIVLAAKEGLGLLNGTAASASVASLALYESNHLAILAQLLTAMGCEALQGSASSFHPFLAAVRPHKGQVEAASNIFSFLSGSRLAHGLSSEEKHPDMGGLAQDRYPLRTSSQWVGPQLEDLMLANTQVTVELNSTTDNPLIDVASDIIHHGGNFQAASITSAMEKTRLSIQMLGKMLFAQCTEIINPSLNKGLPPNLCSDDPSVSFTCKGIDISVAAYYSELAFLSNPVSTHVQSAEMHNQAINSLALISARYTLQAVELLSMISANYVVMVLQALDLRVLQLRFFNRMRPEVAEMTRGILRHFLVVEPEHSEKIIQGLWSEITKVWDSTTTLDLRERCARTADVAAPLLMKEIAKIQGLKASVYELFQALDVFKKDLAKALEAHYSATRQEMFERHVDITPTYLGQASTKLYVFVRKALGVPFHRGLVDDPTHPLEGDQHASFSPSERKSIGSLISIVYESIRNGKLHEPVMAAVKQNLREA
jgi:phenylalanine ammonia-lyase